MHYNQVLEQIPVSAVQEEVLEVLVVVGGNFEEDTVQEGQVGHIFEVEGYCVRVEGVGHRSYSMNIPDRLDCLLGWRHAQILIL